MDYVYYCTHYISDSNIGTAKTRFASGFVATGLQAAEELIKVRNLGEVIDGRGEKLHWWTSPSKHLRDLLELPFKSTDYNNKLADLLHQVCFLLFLGERSGRFVEKNLYGDLGLMHQLIHLLSIARWELGNEFDSVYTMLDRLATSAPEMFKPK